MQSHRITGTAAGELIRADALLAFGWVSEGATRWTPGAHGGFDVPSTAWGEVVFLGVQVGQAFAAAPLSLDFIFTTGVHAGAATLTLGGPWSWDPAMRLLDPHRARGGDVEAEGAVLFTAALARESRVAEEVRLQGTDELGHWAPLGVPVPAEVMGGAGDDTLVGGAAADGLHGEAGSDRILGGDGADTIVGGAGRDILDGQRGDDFILGGDGNDVISAGSGYDTLSGGGGNDVLYAFRGPCTMEGGEGDDTLVGGRGWNEIHGGSGADLFLLGKGWPLPPYDPWGLTEDYTHWYVLDFAPEEGDRVDLRHFHLAEQGIGVLVSSGVERYTATVSISLSLADGRTQHIANLLRHGSFLSPDLPEGWLLV
jgi:hypothetical protein